METEATAAADHVRPNELRFDQVRPGHSKTLALSINGPAGDPCDLEVVAPPLAPFSVVERRQACRVRPDGRRSEVASTTTLWIRYDAVSPMASDVGRVVVTDRGSGARWTVDLRGSGELALG